MNRFGANRLRGFARGWLFLVFISLFVGGNSAYAQSCNDDYSVVSGDTLSKISRTYYGDWRKWTAIYNVNLDTIGEDPNLILIGQYSGDTIRFLTADDYAPFTDRKLINGGIVTHMLRASLAANPSRPEFVISWINDWSTHLDPLLTTHEHDLGFPWLQPDCEASPDDYRCQNFKFSHPIFEMLILLFTDKDRPMSFASDADIEGAVLCRPKGYYTHDLEKDGRLWLTNNIIELKQPDNIKGCFDLLAKGEVDAVALNEFTGRAAVSELQLTGQVEVLENRPLSVEGLHVVVHKSHPRANELIDLVNDSMTEFQLGDTYDAVVDMHFRAFWSKID